MKIRVYLYDMFRFYWRILINDKCVCNPIVWKDVEWELFGGAWKLFSLWEFFTSVLADGFSQESEWQ